MSELDRTLDAALRAMVAGEGPADLRRKVLARIHEPAPRSAPTQRVLLAAAGIAGAVVVVALLRSAPGREVVAPSANPSALTRPVAPPVMAAAATPARPHLKEAPLRPRHRSADRPRPEEPVVQTHGGDLEPIELTPLAVAPLEAHRVAIAPLRIEPMHIDPLEAPEP